MSFESVAAITSVVDRHALPLISLWLISAAANALVPRLHSPIPGNALAIIAMLVLLTTTRSALRFFEATASLLVRHLSLFFVPLAIAILSSWEAFIRVVIPLGVTVAVSVAVGIAATGIVAQRFYRRPA